MTEPAMSISPATLNSGGGGSGGGPSAAPKDQRQYTCLCNSMHLRTGALLIGVLEAAAVLVAVLTVVIKYAKGDEANAGSLAGVLISAALWTAAIVCLYLAIRGQKQLLVMPHLIVQGLSLLGLLVFAIVLGVSIITDALNNHSVRISTIVILIVVMAATALDTWFIVVIAKYYHFLRGQL